MGSKRIDRKAVILQSEVRAIKRALANPAKGQPAAEVLDRLDATFAAYEPRKVKQAFEQYHADGELEVDEGATCSRGNDPGCYVQAWVWVYDKGAS